MNRQENTRTHITGAKKYFSDLSKLFFSIEGLQYVILT